MEGVTGWTVVDVEDPPDLKNNCIVDSMESWCLNS